MVELLVLAGIIIGLRSLYLWATKGKEEAKAFADKSTRDVSRIVLWIGGIAALIFLLLVLLIVGAS